jgi:hypothetical protein
VLLIDEIINRAQQAVELVSVNVEACGQQADARTEGARGEYGGWVALGLGRIRGEGL